MDRSAVVAGIERVCAASGETRALRARVVDVLRAATAFDAYAFVLTDPETEVGVDPLAEVPPLPESELPTLIRLKYRSAVNRWTSLDSPPAAGLRDATGDRPEESPLWGELLVRHDVGDVASVVFRDRFGCWGFLDLWRLGPRARFDEAALALLAAAVEPVTTALRRAQARTLLERPAEPSRFGPVVLTLSDQLRLQGQTPEAAHYLRTLLPRPSGAAAPVPAAAYNVAAQLLAAEAGVDAHPAAARVHLADGRWLTVRAARLAGAEPRTPGTSGTPGTPGSIAVTLETASPTERAAVFARAFALSPRESELLAHVAAGHETREIAALMFVSEYTVQDHLKSVFAKTGLRNRRALISLATGA